MWSGRVARTARTTCCVLLGKTSKQIAGPRRTCTPVVSVSARLFSVRPVTLSKSSHETTPVLATDGPRGQQSATKPSPKASSESQERADGFVDLSVPTETWTAASRQLVERLSQNELTESEGWKKISFYVDVSVSPDDARIMTRLDSEQTGRFFKYAHWYNEQRARLKGMVEFGRYLQGLPSVAHGGASATIADTCMGLTVLHSGSLGVTVSLDVKYVSFVRVDVPYLTEAWIERIDGRKVHVSFTMVDANSDAVCVTASSVFLKPRKDATEEEPDDQYISAKDWFIRTQKTKPAGPLTRSSDPN